MPIFQEPFTAFCDKQKRGGSLLSPCRTLQLLAVALAFSCAATVNTGCSDAVVQADREQQKIERSPEAKRQQREAAERGVEGTTEALEGMENAFDTDAAPQPDAQSQPDKPPEETPQ
jgi:hypothetical protein